MKTISTSEAIQWCQATEITLDERKKPRIMAEGFHGCRLEIPQSASKHLWFCRFIESALRPWDRCLLWVTQWGIWKSSENWHLYYRLRQNYGEHQLIEDAPAHVFLDYETHDLVSFLQIGLGSGWDMCLLSQNDYTRIFISHDEWIELLMRDKSEMERAREELVKSGLKVLPSKA